MFKSFKSLTVALLASVLMPTFAHADVSISGYHNNSTITITSCDWAAGAICSMTYGGKEFIDKKDHGRLLQSASSFNGLGESYNPTEGGSNFFIDGMYPQQTKTSKLLYRRTASNYLMTDTNMGFWNYVWDLYDQYKHYTTSNHFLTKEVRIGALGYSNVIEYLVTYTVPDPDLRVLTKSQFEVLTAYMPSEFSQFYTVAKSGNVATLSPTPVGEQPLPIMFATPSGSHALAIYSPEAPQPTYPAAGYGRWKFSDCVKFNYVMRFPNASGIYKFRAYLVIGTQQEVTATLTALQNKDLGPAPMSSINKR